MLNTNRYKTAFITFIVLSSLFSTCFFTNSYVYAQEEEPEESIVDILKYVIALSDMIYNFEDPMSPHPYRYAGIWEANRTFEIKGQMVFDLYFFSNILSAYDILGYNDEVIVSVYQLLDGQPEKIKNISKDVASSKEGIEKTKIYLKNLNLTLNSGDKLLFNIEIIPSEKPINNLAEKNYDRILRVIEKIQSLLEKSDDEKIQELATAITVFLDLASEIENDEELLGKALAVFRSAAFFYGSSKYKSSVKFPINETDDATIYFQDKYPYDGFNVTGFLNGTAPTGKKVYSWPPVNIFYNLDVLTGEIEEILDPDEQAALTLWVETWLCKEIGGLVEPGKETKREVYYLHNDDKMNSKKPGSDDSLITHDLSNDISWKGPDFSRNKIIEEATADIYIHYPKLLSIIKPTINVSLYDGKTWIATSKKEVNQATLMDLLNKGPEVPTKFDFDIENGGYEITYGHDITLKVSIDDKPPLDLRPIKLLYNSDEYPSSVNLLINETDNIQIGEVKDKKIYAGGSAHYILKIESEYADDLNIDVEGIPDDSGWKFDHPDKISVKEGLKEIDVYINSTANDSSVYGQEIDVFFNVTGKKGFDSKKVNIEISEEAVVYDVEVLSKTKNLEIKHGETKTFKFIIRNKNSGYLEDKYNIAIQAENDNITADPEYYEFDEELDVYDKDGPDQVILNVKLSIPTYFDKESDKLTLNLESSQNTSYIKTVNFKILIVTPNILENTFHALESAFESMGIDGELGAWVFIIVILAIIIFFVIIIILILTRKYVEIICIDRIKEINTDEKAEYEITIRNPKNYFLNYEIRKELDYVSNKWDVSLNLNHVSLQPKQSKTVKLSVVPTDYTKSDDWIEVKILVKPLDKAKEEKISTVTSIKNGRKKLHISGLINWPKNFKRGERVETSFKLYNKGNVSAENVKVILYINGEEKNKIENITIPRGGYADIQIPWIAEKGKNELNIVVK